jgi:hypothetical protein
MPARKRFRFALRPITWGSGRNFDFCYAGSLKTQTPAKIKGVAGADISLIGAQRRGSDICKPSYRVDFHLTVTKIKISPGTPKCTFELILWRISCGIELSPTKPQSGYSGGFFLLHRSLLAQRVLRELHKRLYSPLNHRRVSIDLRFSDFVRR